MNVFTWDEILTVLNTGKSLPFFDGGCGISIGSFDGCHKGHRKLLSLLIEKCNEKKSKDKNFKSGVISFSRPLPSIKHSDDYSGDITTLNQRLETFEKLGLDFAIIVDFDDEFASMMGTDFLNLLRNICNMEVLAEGIDFRCGFKGATDSQAIKYWAQKNSVECIFVDSVYYQDSFGNEERISSSYIRKMIQKGFFKVASEMLSSPYEYDIQTAREKNKSTQILPPDGIYHPLSENNEDTRIEIKERKIINLPLCNRLKFL
ncbi:MAG: FAD synthetase family protein [Spirochaetales bacterium]|nr:FAD synthetase family protein [Spirochaetales bacterium]